MIIVRHNKESECTGRGREKGTNKKSVKIKKKKEKRQADKCTIKGGNSQEKTKNKKKI